VDKFVGDMLMAIFGAPKSYGSDAVYAAKCALAMIEERRCLNHSSHHHIEMGIGLASGEVVAGCMGSEDRMNYTVLGERVNLAARLCSHAGGMQVLIDESTLAQLPPDTQAASLPALRLKGFSETVEAFRLEAVGVVVEAGASIEETSNAVDLNTGSKDSMSVN
jgi:class 3 adenylate cyclase